MPNPPCHPPSSPPCKPPCSPPCKPPWNSCSPPCSPPCTPFERSSIRTSAPFLFWTPASISCSALPWTGLRIGARACFCPNTLWRPSARRIYGRKRPPTCRPHRYVALGCRVRRARPNFPWETIGLGLFRRSPNVDPAKPGLVRTLDAPLFLAIGLTGLLIAYLWFVSHHDTNANRHLFWAWPVHALAAVLLLVRRTPCSPSTCARRDKPPLPLPFSVR